MDNIALGGKKGSTICVLKVLQKYTDSSHRFTQQQIIDKVFEDYEIKLERKAIASSLDLLSSVGYNISRDSKIGICLMENVFTESEASCLIDAVYSSKSISGAEAENLANKINKTMSDNQAKRFPNLYKTGEINRTRNFFFFKNLDIINEAIEKKQLIEYQYLEYNDKGTLQPKYNGMIYKVAPLYVVNSQGKYYLICGYMKSMKQMNVRIDYMTDVRNIYETAPNISEFKEMENFNIVDFINDHFYMFGGEVRTIKLLIERDDEIKNIVDWFGQPSKDLHSKVTIQKDKEGRTIATVKACEKDISYWLMQYSENIKILEPADIQQNLISKLERILLSYKDLQSNRITSKDISKDLEVAIADADKVDYIINTTEDTFIDDFKKYLESYFGSIYTITKEDNKLILTNNINNDVKFMLLPSFKTGDATDDKFAQMLKNVVDVQMNKFNYTAVYAICLTNSPSYFLIDSPTEISKYFNSKNACELKSKITYNGEEIFPMSPFKIEWKTSRGKKYRRFYCIKG